MLTMGTQKKWRFTSRLIIIALVIGLAVGFKAYQKHQARQARFCFAKAETLCNYKKYQEAVKEYEFVAAKYSRSEYVPACWYKAGYIYRYFLFDDAAAARALKKLLGQFPANQYQKETLVLLVDIYARLGQYKEQNDTIRRLLAEFPGAVDEDALRLELSKGLYKLGQDKEALAQLALIKNKKANVVRQSQEYYQLLITRDSSNPQPHLELARIYRGLGLEQKAQDELIIAARLKQRQKKAQKSLPAKPSRKSAPKERG